MPVSHNALDTYKLGVNPRLLPLGGVLLRPKERLVMVNLVVFKDKATKPHEGLTGREAYMKYAASAVQAQEGMGSKMLWKGNISEQLIGTSEPCFEVGALLEYANPRTFINYATGGKADTKARTAGLLGQWLLACTTEHSEEAPAGGVVLFEVIGMGDVSWRANWLKSIETLGGRLVWSGRVDQHILGKASPSIERVILHWLPDEAVASLLASDSVRAFQAGDTPTRPWWVFSAQTEE